MQSHSVLIVEDEQIFAMDLQQQLESMGYDAYGIAASYSEALQHVTDRRPDVVLMDIRIKGRRDGVETAAMLHNDFGVPVIYLTAQDDDATFNRAKGSDPYGYLLKPVKVPELRRALEISIQRAAHERAIREREKWFSTTLQALDDGVVTFDTANEIQFINPAAEMIRSSARDDRQSQILTVDERESPDQIDFEDESGRRRVVVRTKRPVSDHDAVLGSVLVIRDITERLENEQKLELASRMASLGTMAAGVAHEIANPLTVILGNAAFMRETIERELPASSQPEVLQQLLELGHESTDAAQRINAIVADMKVFAHPNIDAHATANVADVIERVAKTTRYQIERCAALTLDVGSPLPLAAIDANRLTQVLVNLVVNASHAMSMKNKAINQIEICARQVGDKLEIAVSDNGSGMSQATMRRVFDPFFTTKDVDKGTGLGLAISHRIIADSGGEISVESAEGIGTIFRVKLRIASKVAS